MTKGSIPTCMTFPITEANIGVIWLVESKYMSIIIPDVLADRSGKILTFSYFQLNVTSPLCRKVIPHCASNFIFGVRILQAYSR